MKAGTKSPESEPRWDHGSYQQWINGLEEHEIVRILHRWISLMKDKSLFKLKDTQPDSGVGVYKY